MSKSSALIALSLCILVTYFWRSLPFLALRGKKLSPSLSRLGELLPPSIMAILLIYSTRSIVTGGASLRLSLIAGSLPLSFISGKRIPSSPSLPAPSSTSPCGIFSKKIGRLPSLQSSLSFCFMRCHTSYFVILHAFSYFLRFHTSCAATLTALLHAPFYDLAAFYDSLLLSPGL